MPAPTRAPLVKDPPRRVSLLALYSLVVAVVGAFTLVGSAAGAVLALIALVRMRTGRVRRGGEGYAVAALVVAVAGAGATVGILYHPAASRIVGWQRRGGVASRVDTSGPPQVGSRDNACVLPRPARLGEAPPGSRHRPAIDYLQTNRDLILTGPRGEAYIDIHRDPGIPGDLREYRDRLALELQAPAAGGRRGRQPDERSAQARISRSASIKDCPTSTATKGGSGSPTCGAATRPGAGSLRVYRKLPAARTSRARCTSSAPTPPAGDTRRLEPEMRKALDSVRFPP